MEAFMQKPVSKLPEAKQANSAQLENVKPLLMKSIHGDDDDHDHAEKVTDPASLAISTPSLKLSQRNGTKTYSGCNPWKISGTYAAKSSKLDANLKSCRHN